MISVGCKSNSACLAAVTLGQILQRLQQTSAEHGSLLLLPDPSLSRDAYDYHSYLAFFESSPLCKGAGVAYISFQEVCLPETGDSQCGQTPESDYKVFISVLRLKEMYQASILKKRRYH